MDLGRYVGLSAAWVNTMKNIITKHLHLRTFCLSIIHLFIIHILDRAIQHKRGLCRQDVEDGFCYITRKTIYSVHKYKAKTFWLRNHVDCQHNYVSLAVF